MFIYVASPYSSPDREIEVLRYEAVMAFMAERINDRPKEVLYSPILHAHVLAERFELPKDAAWWRRHSHTILQRASALYVLGITGWKDSKGVKMEMEFATDLHMPITIWKWNEALEQYCDHPYML